MLQLINLSHQWSATTALDALNFTLPSGHLAAVIGAPGSGKTTLAALLGGYAPLQSGAILVDGVEVTSKTRRADVIACVGATAEVLHTHLNVKENVVGAILLREGGLSRREAVLRADKLLVLCGLDHLAGQRTYLLDLTQKRRLCMAVALAANPGVLVCDGFTDHIFPRAAQELLALLQQVKQAQPGRTVINTTANTDDMMSYDSVVLLHEGRGCFHGPPRAVKHYFSIEQMDELRPKLAKRPAERWQDSWDRHKDAYYVEFGFDGKRTSEDSSEKRPGIELPTWRDQVTTLLLQQWTMYRRESKGLWAQIGLLALFVLLVSIQASGDVAACSSAVIIGQLALLMGGAIWVSTDVIAGKMAQYLTESPAGLRRSAWLTSRAVFALVPSLAQAVVIILASAILIRGLPGNGAVRAALYLGTSLATCMLSIGASAWFAQAGRARGWCWMAGFINLLFGGAVFVWPAALNAVLPPLLTLGVAFSSCMQNIGGSTPSWFAHPTTAITLLAIHAGFGVMLTIAGVKRHLAPVS